MTLTVKGTYQVCADSVSRPSWFMSETTETTCCQINQQGHSGNMEAIFMWGDKIFPDTIKPDQELY